MKKKIIPPNHITKLREKRDMSIYVLADKVGISPSQMSRIENSKSGLKPKLLLKTAAALKVPTNQIVDVPIAKKLQATGDDVMIGEAIGWLLEAGEELGFAIPRQQLSKLVSLLYKEYVEKPLTLDNRKSLAYMMVRVMKICGE